MMWTSQRHFQRCCGIAGLIFRGVISIRKLGGPKAVAMLVTLYWGLQSVVDPGFTKGGGGGGGHKTMDACCLYDHSFII